MTPELTTMRASAWVLYVNKLLVRWHCKVHRSRWVLWVLAAADVTLANHLWYYGLAFRRWHGAVCPVYRLRYKNTEISNAFCPPCNVWSSSIWCRVSALTSTASVLFALHFERAPRHRLCASSPASVRLRTPQLLATVWCDVWSLITAHCLNFILAKTTWRWFHSEFFPSCKHVCRVASRANKTNTGINST